MASDWLVSLAIEFDAVGKRLPDILLMPEKDEIRVRINSEQFLIE